MTAVRAAVQSRLWRTVSAWLRIPAGSFAMDPRERAASTCEAAGDQR